MKKTLLSIGTFLTATIISLNVNAQCTPDPLYADSVYGIWPDTTENLPDAQCGQYYETFVDFKVPSDAGAIDPTYTGVPVNWIRLDGISGLNAAGLNMTYAAGPNGANQWNANQQGCAKINGVPTALGIYALTMDVTAELSLSGFPVSQAQQITGYRIEVVGTCPAVGIANVAGSEFALAQNTPNPFNSVTNISFTSPNAGLITLTVFNMIGETVIQKSITANEGVNTFVINGTELPEGIYTYTLNNQEQTISKRMIVARK